jgi:prepilin-type N-terminal cleavage/methylation domain-containing protein/prepilin-type processing-associated H-X9-DG protein
MRKRTAFTLVELLVVIGIIALLISILLPALSNARRAGNTVKCLSNLRQVSTALQMYAGDFKGAIPWCRDDTNVNLTGIPDYWSDRLAPYVSRLNGATANDAAQQDEVRRTVLWGCSEWIARLDLTTSQRFYPGYAWTLHPYLLPEDTKVSNARANSNWPGVYPPTGNPSLTYRLASVRYPAERALAADSLLWLLDARPVAAGAGINALPGQPVDQIANNSGKTGQAGLMDYDFYRHTKRPAANGDFLVKSGKVACNIVYFDGHAATITGLDEGYRAIFIKAP